MGSYSRVALVSWCCVAVGACVIDPVDVAPDGARLTLSVEPDSIAPDSGQATVRATIFVEAGDLLAFPANVTFLVDGGSLCRGSDTLGVGCGRSAAELPPALATMTSDGVALATFRSAAGPDTVTVVARSGSAADTARIVVAAAGS